MSMPDNSVIRYRKYHHVEKRGNAVVYTISTYLIRRMPDPSHEEMERLLTLAFPIQYQGRAWTEMYQIKLTAELDSAIDTALKAIPGQLSAVEEHGMPIPDIYEMSVPVNENVTLIGNLNSKSEKHFSFAFSKAEFISILDIGDFENLRRFRSHFIASR